MNRDSQQTAVTGIKPTGTPHLGNYLGMIRPSLELAQRFEAFYFIADYHALTTVTDGQQMRDLTYEATATWLALGLDPTQVTLYRQSDVPGVCELTWILLCSTPKGLLNRAHAYKAAVDSNRESGRDPDVGVSMGLFNYPVLMAADILYPSAHVVPVGLDQKQHIEITQDIAEAFNATYGPVLRVPEAIIEEEVMTVPGLDGRKMSKSYNNVIPILAPPKELRKAVMRIKTDSRPPEEPKDPEKDTIFQLFRQIAPADAVESMRQRYLQGGLGYGQAKEEFFQALDECFREPRERYEEMMADRGQLDRILSSGAERARERGTEVLARVRDAVGAQTEPARAAAP
ncbi:MAG: tryptophan--tRNA ligase [Chloroflexota bacterium]